ncbi:hypothetical protein [Flexivirga alba]|uniref:Uncharacterized protein n=1 Tax=Flexivirga alba TaxID=702742 RepID=A0ABW2AIJ2_9MICO
MVVGLGFGGGRDAGEALPLDLIAQLIHRLVLAEATVGLVHRMQLAIQYVLVDREVGALQGARVDDQALAIRGRHQIGFHTEDGSGPYKATPSSSRPGVVRTSSPQISRIRYASRADTPIR